MSAFSQELITFQPISLPKDVRKALAAARPEEHSLPESIPNPSLNHMVDDFGNAANGSTIPINGLGNGFNKLKLRVPMERRYVVPSHAFIES